MSDLLAIAEEADADEQLIEEISRSHADRVTVLLADEAHAHQMSSSEPVPDDDARLAKLLNAIEQRTGAVVVGFAGSREQLRGWRFDRTVEARGALSNA